MFQNHLQLFLGCACASFGCKTGAAPFRPNSFSSRRCASGLSLLFKGLPGSGTFAGNVRSLSSSTCGLVSRDRAGLTYAVDWRTADLCLFAGCLSCWYHPLAGLRHAGGDHGPDESPSDSGSDSSFSAEVLDRKPECWDGMSRGIAGDGRALGSKSSSDMAREGFSSNARWR